MLVVLASAGGSLGIASEASATPPDTPIFDLAGNPDAISIDAPFVYNLTENATAVPSPGWTALVNDSPTGVNPLGGLSTIWTDGDVLNIVVAPPSAPGGINHVEAGDYITFASTPFVGITGTEPATSGLTGPTVTAALTTYPGDSADSNDAGIKDDLAITFTGTVDPADTSFILQIGIPSDPVEYNTGPHEPIGAITTINSNYISQRSGTATLDFTASSGGPMAITPSPPIIALPFQISGTDAIGTSIAVSQAEFPVSGSAKAVVLARSDYFSDALSGGPLAAAVGGPLLITPGASISAAIDPRVLGEIERVLPVGGTVYVLGGDLAISPGVDSALQAAGYNVIREAGSNEFDTAVKIAQQLGNRGTIFLATGLSFYDALSAVPAAIAANAEILLTDGSTQNLETALYMLQYPNDKVYAIGGPEAAFGADPEAIPVYGQDLFGTSAAVASTFFPGAATFGAATSADFPDALGGGVFMATGGRLGAVLLVPPTTPLPAPITSYLASLAPGTMGYVFGGPLAVPLTVISALSAAVG